MFCWNPLNLKLFSKFYDKKSHLIRGITVCIFWNRWCYTITQKFIISTKLDKSLWRRREEVIPLNPPASNTSHIFRFFRSVLFLMWLGNLRATASHILRFCLGFITNVIKIYVNHSFAEIIIDKTLFCLRRKFFVCEYLNVMDHLTL